MDYRFTQANKELGLKGRSILRATTLSRKAFVGALFGFGSLSRLDGQSRQNVSATHTWMVDRGVAAEKPYVLESVSMFVRFSDTSTHPRAAHVRTSYGIVALRDIRRQERVFQEAYKASASAKVLAWAGSNPEEYAADGSYDVALELKKDEHQTVITGSEVQYPASDGLKAGPQEWFYPSTDVIGEIIMVLEDDAGVVSPLKLTAKRYSSKGEISETPLMVSQHSPRSLIARWSRVLPGEEVSIPFRFGPDPVELRAGSGVR
jgi:hypothetical protein